MITDETNALIDEVKNGPYMVKEKAVANYTADLGKGKIILCKM